MDDITLTFLRSRRPRKLLRQLSEKGYTITEPYAGIYYIQKDTYLMTQIIVTEELDSEEHVWLRARTDRLKEEDAEQAMKKKKSLYAQERRRNIGIRHRNRNIRI
jgi:hypothetical protein